jgi:predicted ArsR family transcriptional regulator
MTPTDLRENIEAAIRAEPDVPASEIARRFGVSRQRVQVLLRELGYRLVWRRVRGKVGRPAGK